MNLLKKWLLVSMVTGMLVFAYALAQETGEGGGTEAGGGAAAEPGAPSYFPGTVPTIPGTDVPAPAGEGAASAPEAGAAGAAPAEGEAGGGAGGGAAPGTYVEGRKDQLVFQTSCLKCHPKEKILKRRTEAQWKAVVLQKHLMQGRIFSSDAAPVLRYLNANFGVKPAATPAAVPRQPAAPAVAPPAAPAAQPGATLAPPAEPAPAPPAEPTP